MPRSTIIVILLVLFILITIIGQLRLIMHAPDARLISGIGLAGLLLIAAIGIILGKSRQNIKHIPKRRG
ncbi:MAG TPA: hypothetical protein VFR58_17985 [Flavisolibacter sp.]|nr:hypothetical protein [Flavisolibacter sp.]